MPTRGSNSYLFLLKVRKKVWSHQLQTPFDDQPWNEMEFNRLYEHICVGFEGSQILSYDGMNNQPLHLANIDFSSTKISFVGSFSDCMNSFIDRRMGLCEWMAWIWSTHDHTPSIHNTLVTWHPTLYIKKPISLWDPSHALLVLELLMTSSYGNNRTKKTIGAFNTPI